MRACILCVLAACSAPVVEGDPTRGRLPDDVAPLAYTLKLDIDMTHARLTGDATIQTRLTRPRRTVWLHARDLKISSVRVTRDDGGTLDATYDVIGDLLRVVLADQSKPQDITLAITYERPLTVVDGTVAAELGAMNARAWFPCFDEPRFKTPFDITITAPPNAMAVTATAPREVRDGHWEFARTAPLPAHLITFVVGSFDVVESGRVRGLAPRGHGSELRYVVDQATPLLEAIERYVGSPYPFDKLDIIAVRDLPTGALENPGAVSFKADLVLIDPSDEEARRNAIEALAHELAHMWFGDLVTMEWWDDLWLSEGFASWMGRRAVQTVEPSFGADADRVEAMLGAMQRDNLMSIRPVRHPVTAIDDVAFDAITYGKGMGIIAMLEAYMGEDKFRAAVRRYIEAHRFGTATTDDFLAALHDPTAVVIAKSFLGQPGLPWVSASVKCPNIELHQERYAPLGATGMRKQTWVIPVCTADQCWVLSRPDATFTVDHCTANAPFLNRGATGYYRFEPPADDHALSATEMLAVADARAASVLAGKTEARVFLSFLPELVARHDRRLDHRVMETLKLTRDHHIDAETRPALEAYARALFANRPHALTGSADETSSQRLDREGVAYFLVDVGNDGQLRKLAASGDAPAFIKPLLRDEPTELTALLETCALDDAATTLTNALRHHETRDAAKAWLRRCDAHLPPTIAANLCSYADVAWVGTQFANDQATRETAETVAQCAAFDKRYHREINAYFRGLHPQ